MPTVFFSYSHKDEALRDQLEVQLTMLKREGLIETWHDRRIGAGQEFSCEIDRHIEQDDIILLLVSPDFLASDYCYDREMQRALARHEAGTAVVIPVILRPCDWHHAPFGKLLATPTDGRPVTQWADRDQAMLEIARAVRAAVAQLGSNKASENSTKLSAGVLVAPVPAGGPRSSNLRVAKQFSDRDRDAYRVETFDYIAHYFENSIDELGQRNPGVEGQFRRIDANRFTAAVYRHGQTVARCSVFMGGTSFSTGIAYSNSDDGGSNSFNENLTVHSDDQSMYLQSMGMASYMRQRDEKLTQEGAAELFWGMFIAPLQRG